MEKENKDKEIKSEIKKEESAEEQRKKKEEKPEGAKTEEKVEERKKEKKPEVKKPKKTEAIINIKNLPISTKASAAICRFIKKKKIENAIADLEQVLILKKAIPMKGEIPHRKGRGMMSGGFPKNATRNFIKLLKSLSANATYNGLEEPVIVEAVANIGERPYGKFGWVRKKRTHVRIKATEIKKEK